jgi:hypothetical protein
MFFKYFPYIAIMNVNSLLAQQDSVAIANNSLLLPNKNLQKINFTIAPNYAETYYGIICKKELQLEKITHIPFRLRVGSLDNCNRLEGKIK